MAMVVCLIPSVVQCPRELGGVSWGKGDTDRGGDAAVGKYVSSG